MKKVADILFGVAIQEVFGQPDQQIQNIAVDSRHIRTNDLFIAINGYAVNGHEFIDQAIDNGATVIVCQQLPEVKRDHVTYYRVADSRKACAIIASNYYDHPSSDLRLIGVTGTNGKTTIVTLLYQLFSSLGVASGLLSTVENRIGQHIYESKLTTPDSIALNHLLRQMVDAGCEVCFMEVSSHAVDQGRINGLHFSGGVFTNITRDHLDYHKTFKAYIEAKQQFFTLLPKTAFALYNEDDKNGPIMVQNTKARKLSYAQKSLADYRVKVLEESLDGMLLNIQNVDVFTRLTGDFNAMNLLAAYVVAVELGEDDQKVLEQLSNLQGAPGRFQKVVSPKGIIGIVDYSHTPDSLEKVLQTINKLRTGIEQLTTVVGCGGDRDRGKRPLMGAVAADLSDHVILTSDNPRSENPNDIIQEMSEGVKITQKQKLRAIPNRRDAIFTAVSMSQPGDVILVAGKGHEDYQEIKGERFPFDDCEVLKEAYQSLND